MIVGTVTNEESTRRCRKRDVPGDPRRLGAQECYYLRSTRLENPILAFHSSSSLAKDDHYGISSNQFDVADVDWIVPLLLRYPLERQHQPLTNLGTLPCVGTATHDGRMGRHCM